MEQGLVAYTVVYMCVPDLDREVLPGYCLIGDYEQLLNVCNLSWSAQVAVHREANRPSSPLDAVRPKTNFFPGRRNSLLLFKASPSHSITHMIVDYRTKLLQMLHLDLELAINTTPLFFALSREDDPGSTSLQRHL